MTTLTSADLKGWAAEQAVGRQRASDMITSMRASGNPMDLGYAVRAMVQSGIYGAAEVGFMHRIAEVLITCETLA